MCGLARRTPRTGARTFQAASAAFVRAWERREREREAEPLPFPVHSFDAVIIGFGIVLRTVEAHGRTDVPLPPGPPFFRFSDPEECVRAMKAAGFEGTEGAVELPMPAVLGCSTAPPAADLSPSHNP